MRRRSAHLAPRGTARRRVVLAAFVASAVVVVPAAATAEPRWADALAICGRLRAEGWTSADPLAGNDPGDVTVGGSVGIQLCRVTRALPAGGRGRAPQLEVFMQHRGGHAANVTGRYWHAADRTATLAAASALVARLARDLAIPLPPEVAAAVLAGDSYEDTHGGALTSVTAWTRVQELQVQPDLRLRPEAVPLLSLDISFTPPE